MHSAIENFTCPCVQIFLNCPQCSKICLHFSDAYENPNAYWKWPHIFCHWMWSFRRVSQYHTTLFWATRMIHELHLGLMLIWVLSSEHIVRMWINQILHYSKLNASSRTRLGDLSYKDLAFLSMLQAASAIHLRKAPLPPTSSHCQVWHYGWPT